MGLVRQNPIQKTVRTANVSVLAQLSVQHTAQKGSHNLPSYLQTITIAQMLSIGGKGEFIHCHSVYNYDCLFGKSLHLLQNYKHQTIFHLWLCSGVLTRTLYKLKPVLCEKLNVCHGLGGSPKLLYKPCLLYTSPSPRDGLLSRMPSSA